MISQKTYKRLLRASQIVLGLIAGFIGVLAVIGGEQDDSPGLQGLGCILILSTATLIFLTRRTERNDGYAIKTIGVVRSTRTEPIDDDWDSESSQIELLPEFGERSLRGLTEFSHCEVVYIFDRAEWVESNISRHPRGNLSWPEVGIFAQRAKDRPNRLGVTVCRVVEVTGSIVRVAGLDAIDGTPVVDIKPYMAEYAPRGNVIQPAWSQELMANYWQSDI